MGCPGRPGMTNKPVDGDSIDEQLDTSDPTDTAASSTYKVLGEFSDTSGAGVLGKNTATSGTPIGVQGAVPNNSGGYGLQTPDDARIDGVAELSTLGGNLTGGTEMTNIVGENLAIDAEGNLNTHTYRTTTFDTSWTTWDAITELPGETPVEVTVDANDVTWGRVSVIADGSHAGDVGVGEVLHRIVGPTSSVRVRSVEEPVFDTAYDVSGQESRPVGVAFENDGTRMFVAGPDSGLVHEYNLSTAWDISTATFDSSFDFSKSDPYPWGITFKDDGSKMYLIGTNAGKVFSYNLSTSWDISTAASGTSIDVSGREEVTFKDDGTKMFVCSNAGSSISSYNLSTAWDLSSATPGTTLFVSDQDNGPSDVTFTSDGTTMFVSGSINDNIYLYGVSSPWDLSTASFNASFDVSGQDTKPSGGTLSGDDTQLFLAGTSNDNVYSYDLTYDGRAYASVKKE